MTRSICIDLMLLNGMALLDRYYQGKYHIYSINKTRSGIVKGIMISTHHVLSPTRTYENNELYFRPRNLMEFQHKPHHVDLMIAR